MPEYKMMILCCPFPVLVSDNALETACDAASDSHPMCRMADEEPSQGSSLHSQTQITVLY